MMKQPTMTSSSTMSAVLAVAVILGCTLCTVDATVATTCQAAAASDVRVNEQTCVSQLGTQRGTTEADAWGLAKVAANAGINNAASAGSDVQALAAGNPSLPMKPVLDKCEDAFTRAALAFGDASDAINRRDYAAGRKSLDEALAQAQACNAAFAVHGVTLPQPLAQHTVDTIQIAIIASAVTGLIK